jgi:hypothetical protein
MSDEFSVADKVNAILSPMYKRRQEQAEACLKEICEIVSGHSPSDEKVAQISLRLIAHYSDNSN